MLWDCGGGREDCVVVQFEPEQNQIPDSKFSVTLNLKRLQITERQLRADGFVKDPHLSSSAIC